MKFSEIFVAAVDFSNLAKDYAIIMSSTGQRGVLESSTRSVSILRCSCRRSNCDSLMRKHER